MSKKFDVVVIGAGIAGLGVAAILQQNGKNVALIDKYAQVGGRAQSWKYKDGWTVDIGLHEVELGRYSQCHRLAERVGGTIEWGEWSGGIGVYQDGKWNDLGQMLKMGKQEIEDYKKILKTVAVISDEEIDAWDDKDWGLWLDTQTKSKIVRDMFAIIGMVNTTVLEPENMSAGENLYIMRENLRYTRQALQASYPVGGMKALTEPLKVAFEKAGGTLMLKTTVKEVVVENKKVKGVTIAKNVSPYPDNWNFPVGELIKADRVVCALPIYDLDRIIPMDPRFSFMPEWWTKRIQDIRLETTCLIGYVAGFSEPLFTDTQFKTALNLKRTNTPFQAFGPSNLTKGVAPEGKFLLHCDIPVEVPSVQDPFELQFLLDAMWEEMKEMWPGMEEKLEWRIPYYTLGCDGLARKPMHTGRFKPDLKAPGVEGLYFAGDTYRGRGLALNGAANSGMQCADMILQEG